MESPSTGQKNPRSIDSGWKSLGVLVLVVAVCTALTTLTGTGLAPALAGLVVAVIGGVLVFLAIRRILQENAGLRVPLLAGKPPISPRRFDLRAGAGLPLLSFGGITVVTATTDGFPILLVVGFSVTLTALWILPLSIHNKNIDALAAA